jgi:hypothetical protein
MNPAPPVTRMFIVIKRSSGGSLRGCARDTHIRSPRLSLSDDGATAFES